MRRYYHTLAQKSTPRGSLMLIFARFGPYFTPVIRKFSLPARFLLCSQIFRAFPPKIANFTTIFPSKFTDFSTNILILSTTKALAFSGYKKVPQQKACGKLAKIVTNLFKKSIDISGFFSYNRGSF